MGASCGSCLKNPSSPNSAVGGTVFMALVFGRGVRERREREQRGYERFALHKHKHPAILGGGVKAVPAVGIASLVAGFF